jgi:hypothetical protein
VAGNLAAGLVSFMETSPVQSGFCLLQDASDSSLYDAIILKVQYSTSIVEGGRPAALSRFTISQRAGPGEILFTFSPFHGQQIQEVDYDLRKNSRNSNAGSNGAGRVQFKY